jgi:DNA helicase HerA-like ATPase
MVATQLRLSGGGLTYPIPDSALDDRLGWIGTAGSGKTYNAGSGVERLLESGARVVIVDPLDVWWGLRLTADGKPSRFTLPIFGGAHGDLPLNEQAGKLIGETVAGMAESCIISLGGLPTKAAEQRFMLTFLEALYRNTSGNSVHVVFDEADLWAPQNAGKEGGNGPKLQALMEQIVRRGRIRGFIPWLITQRPAVLSKGRVEPGRRAGGVQADRQSGPRGARRMDRRPSRQRAGQGNSRLLANDAARPRRRLGSGARRSRYGQLPAQAHI